MFRTVFAFEIGNRLRRPALYIYFAAALIFTTLSFSTGSLPLGEKENINAPWLIAFWSAAITMMMMLVSSSILGSAIYRDIEYNTKDYYLTYPVTRLGYFWGRFLGAFFCLAGVALAIPLGVWIGSHLGPLMGWKDAKEYGPNQLWYYVHPFLTIVLPNLFFTAALFFGLVAITRNVKVIYLGGVTLFLGYFLSIFFLNHTSNETVITLSDPFGINAVRHGSDQMPSFAKNHTVFPIEGAFLLNRLIWPGIGLILLMATYYRFSFTRFFAGSRDKMVVAVTPGLPPVYATKKIISIFDGRYRRRTLQSLVRLEIQNIARDNYFWIILALGMVFLGFVCWLGEQQYGVPDLPRTVVLFAIFNDVFPFFLFFLIMFYTGEILHRDPQTRYALINDALPPPNWVLNGSKLISLLLLAGLLSAAPVLVIFIVQLLKGFHVFAPKIYAIYFFWIILPRFVELAAFCYAVQVVVNNKFAGYGVGITLWVGIFLLRATGTFDYNLWLFTQTPSFGVSDMDGIGHMAGPVNWFNLYWLLVAGFLIILAALFYYRGVAFSFKERWQLARERMDRRTIAWTVGLALVFIPVAAFLYYNVSVANDYLTKGEQEQRAVRFEKTLKKYQSLPLPTVSALRIHLALFPQTQTQTTHAWATLVNRSNSSVKSILVDAGELYSLTLATNGHPLAYHSPLLYPRGFFNPFRPPYDTAEYRLYEFPRAMLPGDSTTIEIFSSVGMDGFPNMMYARNLLRNGTMSNGGLPGLGYDEGEELRDNYKRKKFGLPEKADKEIDQDDSAGQRTPSSGAGTDLFRLDITVSTDPDQTAVAPGRLDSSWTAASGRRFFHFVADSPGLYMPFVVGSARWMHRHQTVDAGRPVDLDVYFHPLHEQNVDRMLRGYREGLQYFSAAYGPYPFAAMRLTEGSQFMPREISVTSLDAHPEYFMWNADFRDSMAFDYLYFNSAKSVAKQWWNHMVTPNSTIGSQDISEGLSTYSALALESRRLSPLRMKPLLQDQLWIYLFLRRRMEEREHPLLRSDIWLEWDGKAGVSLYGLRDLIGEDSLNAALREFKNSFAFRSPGPYAGANDLYACLQRHVPDSLKYYLTDTWEKITLYDNRVVALHSTPTGKKDEYRVQLTVDVAKTWMDKKGTDQPVKNMNDWIDIAVYGTSANTAHTGQRDSILYFKKTRLTEGTHTIDVTVQGKPVWAGIDPLGLLIDRLPADNVKEF